MWLPSHLGLCILWPPTWWQAVFGNTLMSFQKKINKAFIVRNCRKQNAQSTFFIRSGPRWCDLCALSWRQSWTVQCSLSLGPLGFRTYCCLLYEKVGWQRKEKSTAFLLIYKAFLGKVRRYLPKSGTICRNLPNALWMTVFSLTHRCELGFIGDEYTCSICIILHVLYERKIEKESLFSTVSTWFK